MGAASSDSAKEVRDWNRSSREGRLEFLNWFSSQTASKNVRLLVNRFNAAGCGRSMATGWARKAGQPACFIVDLECCSIRHAARILMLLKSKNC